MGSIKLNPLVGQANLLLQQVQAAELAADTHIICLATRDALFHRLKGNQAELGELKEKMRAAAGGVNEFERAQIHDAIQGLDQRIIRLYGRIHNLAIDKEVSDIAKEAEDLETTLKSGDIEKVKKAFSYLDDHIQTFIDQHALGREGRHTIATARATRQKAYSYLRTHGLREDRPHLFNQFNLLQLAVPPHEPLQDDEIQAELVLDLYSTAECFYHAKTKEGTQRFNQLDKEAKKRFHIHLALLGEPSGDPWADRIKSAQALIAAAYDLADSHDGETYLSEDQLHDLFSNPTL